jgi:O-methyltransferase
MLVKSNEDLEFIKIMQEIKKTTIVDESRCYMLYQFAKQANNLDGNVAEVGVYKGGTAKLFSKIFNKSIHLFDTFEGMPETDLIKDKHKKGDFRDTSLELVKDFLIGDNIHFYKGFFPNTAENIKDKKFCFVHIDADIYKSVYDCCSFFYERLVNNAIMVFDDYGFPSCPGAKLAVDEFFAEKKRTNNLFTNRAMFHY